MHARAFCRRSRRHPSPRRVSAPCAIALSLAAAVCASPSHAFEYTVEGAQPQLVVVDDDLFTAGVVATSVCYAATLLMGSAFFASAAWDGSAPAQHNAAVGLALSTPPVVNGVLLGGHLLDQQEAYDSREGWAALPAIALWGLSAGQAIGLAVLAGAFVLAPRVPAGE